MPSLRMKLRIHSCIPPLQPYIIREQAARNDSASWPCYRLAKLSRYIMMEGMYPTSTTPSLPPAKIWNIMQTVLECHPEAIKKQTIDVIAVPVMADLVKNFITHLIKVARENSDVYHDDGDGVLEDDSLKRAIASSNIYDFLRGTVQEFEEERAPPQHA